MRINPNQRKTNYQAYAIPLILAFLFLVIIVKIIFWWWTTENRNSNNWSVNVDLNQEKSEIYIFMSWDSKKQIEWQTKMYPTDTKMEVNSWEWKITLDWNNTKLFVNKLWEVKYNWKSWDTENFKIINWEIWAELATKTKINLKNFTIDSAQSVISISQNMVASSIYVLKWEAVITLNSTSGEAKTATIWVWQKLSVLDNDLNNSSFKIEEQIEPIDDIFKQSDFFTKHNWSSYLSSDSTNSDETWSWSSSSWSTSSNKWLKSIMITYPDDEATIDSSTTNIEWKITSSNVEKVTLNDKEASLNKEEKTFIAKDFELTDTVNNIVYKAYDSSNNILAKWVLTIYTSSKDIQKDENNKKPTVTTYPISSKDFRIISPSDNPYKTTEEIVKIAWSVNAWSVKFITINDFRLTKFAQFWTTWYYFANKDYGTMNDWINLYTIKYYWKDDDLLYTSLVTIVKEAKESIENKKDTWDNWTWSITNW